MSNAHDMPLATLQHLVQALITLPGASSLPADRVPPTLLSQLAPGPRRSRLDCINVYRKLVQRRLIGALESQHPGVLGLVGPERFDGLARAYLFAHPSRSFTLADVGQQLPAFIADWSDLPPPLRRAASELAGLELLEAELEGLPAGPTLEQPDAIGLADWERVAFTPAATLRLVTLHACDPFADEPRAMPTEPDTPRHAAVLCRMGRVRRYPLTPAAHRLLDRLRGGALLGAALPAVFSEPTESDVLMLFFWFKQWLAWGFFASASVKTNPTCTERNSP